MMFSFFTSIQQQALSFPALSFFSSVNFLSFSFFRQTVFSTTTASRSFASPATTQFRSLTITPSLPYDSNPSTATMSKTFFLSALLALAEARFGQEQAAANAIQSLSNFGNPGEAATLAGATPGVLLAGSNACAKVKLYSLTAVPVSWNYELTYSEAPTGRQDCRDLG